MSAGILVLSLIVIALAVAAVALFRRLGSTSSTLPVTAQWINELSLDRYRPMLRLLGPADIEFLRSQPGYSRKLESDLRVKRSRIFRGYLQRLDCDFQRVCLALKLVMANSSQDRPDLAGALIQSQIMFASGLLSAHFRLFLYRYGLCTVDAAALVRMFDNVSCELRSLVPTEVATYA